MLRNSRYVFAYHTELRYSLPSLVNNVSTCESVNQYLHPSEMMGAVDIDYLVFWPFREKEIENERQVVVDRVARARVALSGASCSGC